MRRLDTETTHTRQASYFGLITLLTFLVLNVTVLAHRYTDYILPKTVVSITILLFLVTSTLCLFHAVRSRREPRSSSTSKMNIFVGLSVLCWLYILVNLRGDLLGILAS
jgi:hypothetical protein